MREASRPPAPVTALIGRAAECSEVSTLLSEARLVTLTGPPGVGKTRLALAVAPAVERRFADGSVWLDLTSVSDARQLKAELARLIDTGSDPEMLVVLDNLEHVIDAAPDIAALLAATTRLRVLTTSRERLRLSAERECAVLPLPMPDQAVAHDWKALRSNPAVAVLLARAPANVTLSSQTARGIADICIRLDGLPLALELAALRLRVFSPADLAFRLEHHIGSLPSGQRDAPERHRDLRTAIAWSYELLSERDRSVFRRLAVLPHNWTVTAAHAVCDVPDIEESIESLLDKSLISRVDDRASEARFAMLMSLREFAADQLDVAERAEAHHRLSAYLAQRNALGRERLQLTVRQRQVAELVAVGSTNRQIGRTLGISEKTTEIHVHNIMARVHASSRAGVAAWIARDNVQRMPQQRTP